MSKFGDKFLDMMHLNNDYEDDYEDDYNEDDYEDVEISEEEIELEDVLKNLLDEGQKQIPMKMRMLLNRKSR